MSRVSVELKNFSDHLENKIFDMHIFIGSIILFLFLSTFVSTKPLADKKDNRDIFDDNLIIDEEFPELKNFPATPNVDSTKSHQPNVKRQLHGSSIFDDELHYFQELMKNGR